MKSRFLLAGLLGLLAWACPALADGLIVIHNPPHVVPDHFRFAPLAVEYHHVTVRIDEQVAVTEIDQEFRNPNNARLEGTYIFPLPDGAQVDKFSMDVGGKMEEAELLDADKARKIYEDIVRSSRDPALLEYVGRGAYRARIFPIEPNGTKRVKLKYTQVLKSDSGLVHYVYPLNTEKFSSAPIKTVKVNVEVSAKSGLKAVYCPSHEVKTAHPSATKATVALEMRDQRPNTDFSLYYSTATAAGGDIGLNLLTYREGQGDGYFMLLASPGAHVKAEQVVKKDVVLVLDTSGSMAGAKLEQARKALIYCVGNLNEGDRFNLIHFSNEAQGLFDGLVDASQENRARAEKYVAALKATGGTAIDEALALATKPLADRAGAEAARPYVVIFLTDGKPTIGNTDEDSIVKNVAKAAGDRKGRVFCFGVGTELNTRLLDRITEATHAVSQYVLPEEDIEVLVSNFYNKINSPVLADLSIQVASGAGAGAEPKVRLTAMYPKPLPDLFAGEQLLLMGRYTGSGDAAIVVEGLVNGQRRKITYEGSFPESDTAREFVPKLWAVRRVGYLLDEIRLHGESQELKDEVTRLARQFGIVTPYTAYLIVEDEARRNVPVASRTLQALDRDAGLRTELAKGAEHLGKIDGGIGVGNARANADLKSAGNAAAPAAAQANNQYAWGMGGSGARERQAGQVLAQAQNNARFVNGRTFYQNEKTWIDANVQARQQAARVQVKFNSDAYFALLKKHKEAAQWLSVGRNVQVLLGDTVYEIVDES